MIEGVPLPVTDDPVDAAFWQATREKKLVVQRCAQCQRRRFPPRPMCPDCQSEQHQWEQVSGAGRIWSFTSPQPPLLPAFEKLTPYVTALVELEEDPGVRIVGPVLLNPDGEVSGVSVESVAIGAPVTVAFKPYAEDVNLVCWALMK